MGQNTIQIVLISANLTFPEELTGVVFIELLTKLVYALPPNPQVARSYFKSGRSS